MREGDGAGREPTEAPFEPVECNEFDELSECNEWNECNECNEWCEWCECNERNEWCEWTELCEWNQLFERNEWNERKVYSKMCAAADATPEMLGAFLRLLELFKKPNPSSIIRSMIIREIHYHALMSDIGGSIRELNIIGTPNNQIAKAVKVLKENFNVPMQIEDLAKHIGMAQATFYRNFKRVTSVSPLQYQKQLRLHEAKRLMLFENETVSNAAYAVGYESPSQFSREYKRYFGKTPMEDK